MYTLTLKYFVSGNVEDEVIEDFESVFDALRRADNLLNQPVCYERLLIIKDKSHAVFKARATVDNDIYVQYNEYA